MNAGEPLVRVEGLSKRYLLGKAKKGAGHKRRRRELWALRDVSFAVPPATVLGVIGPNGAGKSTLLKLLARVTRPTEGRIVGHGRVMSLLELGAGFQPELTGLENLYLTAALYGISKSVVDQQREMILDFAELHGFEDVPVRHYSSGMYLRLAFSAVIHMEPDILLADEVLAVGDAAFQERCLARVQETSESGSSVLFVSHDMKMLRRVATSVLWLDEGRQRGLGQADEIIAEYESSASSKVAALDETASISAARSTFGSITRARLLSEDGVEIGAARLESPTVVEVAFRLQQPSARMRFAFDLFTRDVLVFRSASAEIVAEAEGLYVARATVPPRLLSDREYRMSISVTTVADDGSEDVAVIHDAVRFHAYGDGGGSARMRGVTAPVLEWSVTPLLGQPGLTDVEVVER